MIGEVAALNADRGERVKKEFLIFDIDLKLRNIVLHTVALIAVVKRVQDLVWSLEKARLSLITLTEGEK